MRQQQCQRLAQRQQIRKIKEMCTLTNVPENLVCPKLQPCCDNPSGSSYLTANGYQCFSSQSQCQQYGGGSGEAVGAPCITGYPENCVATDCTPPGEDVCAYNGDPCCYGFSPYLTVLNGATQGTFVCYQSQNACFASGSFCEPISTTISCGTS